MVKTAGPLLSVNAHGKLAQTLSYQKRKEGNIGRQYHYPHKTISQKQYTRRTILGLLTAHWQCMTDAQKLVWENNAKSAALNISGFNYFVKEAMADLYTHHGLCGYWSLNELTGATAYDYSGQGNDGTLGPTYPSNVASRVDSINKKFGKALSFDEDDTLNVPNHASLNPTSAITIMGWFKTTDVTGGIVGKRATYKGYRLTWASNNLYFGIGNGGNFSQIFIGGYNNNLWHFVVGTWDDSDDAMKLYFDGVLKKSGSQTGPLVNTALPLLIGNSDDQGTLTGLIDEVRVYNRRLSITEIQKQYKLLQNPNRRQLRLI